MLHICSKYFVPVNYMQYVLVNFVHREEYLHRWNIRNSICRRIKYPTAAKANPSSNPTSPPYGASPACKAIGPTNQT